MRPVVGMARFEAIGLVDGEQHRAEIDQDHARRASAISAEASLIACHSTHSASVKVPRRPSPDAGSAGRPQRARHPPSPASSTSVVLRGNPGARIVDATEDKQERRARRQRGGETRQHSRRGVAVHAPVAGVGEELPAEHVRAVEIVLLLRISDWWSCRRTRLPGCGCRRVARANWRPGARGPALRIHASPFNHPLRSIRNPNRQRSPPASATPFKFQ